MGWWNRQNDPKDDLIDAFVWALTLRPDEFHADIYNLHDEALGMDWWIANEDYGFKLLPVGFNQDSSNEVRFSRRQRRRGYNAYIKWARRQGPIRELADRIIDANDKAVKS